LIKNETQLREKRRSPAVFILFLKNFSHFLIKRKKTNWNSKGCSSRKGQKNSPAFSNQKYLFLLQFFLPGTPQEEYCPAANLGKFGKKISSIWHSFSQPKENKPSNK